MVMCICPGSDIALVGMPDLNVGSLVVIGMPARANWFRMSSSDLQSRPGLKVLRDYWK